MAYCFMMGLDAFKKSPPMHWTRIFTGDICVKHLFVAMYNNGLRKRAIFKVGGQRFAMEQVTASLSPNLVVQAVEDDRTGLL